MPKVNKSRSSNVGIAPATPYSTGGKKDGAMRGQSQSNNNLIAPNTSIGQHFLKNPAVVNSIVQKSGVKVGLDHAFHWRNDLFGLSLLAHYSFAAFHSIRILSWRLDLVQET